MKTPFSDDQIAMFCGETFGERLWSSSLCSCRVYLDGNRIRVKPCDFDHTIWAWRVGVPIVEAKCRQWENAVPPESYHAILASYLQWGVGCPLSFGYEIGSYAHGKASREWHITEWKEGISKGLFLAEEFIGVLGCNEQNFHSIFGRKPNRDVLSNVKIYQPAQTAAAKKENHHEPPQRARRTGRRPRCIRGSRRKRA